MLKRLYLKNIALVKDLTIEFKTGLNVVTGESGSGKTIIVQSLELLTGSRAQSELIRFGESKAVIEAEFEKPTSIKEIDEETIIIRRELQQNGQNRVFINDGLVTKQELEQLSEKLIDFHGQHAHQSLLKKEKHIHFLDLFLENTELKKQYRAEYQRLKTVLNQYHEMLKSFHEMQEKQSKSEEIINEIDNTKISQEDEVELKDEEKRLLDSDEILQSISKAEMIISESEISIETQLKQLNSEFSYLLKYDSNLQSFIDEIESFNNSLNESSYSIQNLKSKVELNPNRLQEIQNRLFEYEKLKRKYGNTVEEILKIRNELDSELSDLSESEMKLRELELDIKNRIRTIKTVGEKLSDERRNAAKIVDEKVKHVFKRLDMAHAEIKFQINPVHSTLLFHDEELPFTENGFETVEIKIKTNKGSDFLPIEKIASGGELSRVMLSLKSIMAERDSIPLLIFDEIDSGVSGKIADAVAIEIKNLSKFHQIICITHTPQLSSKGRQHYKVWKEELLDHAETKIKELDQEERINEIAQMISDGKISEHSQNLAKELIGSHG
jgi:DNA repair protein RecN (Recombination protein N)